MLWETKMAVGETKVIRLKMELLKKEFFNQLEQSKKQLFGLADHIHKIETGSKGIFSSWQKGIIVWNQALELVRKIGILFQGMKVPLLESGAFEQFRTTMENLIGSTEIATQRFRQLVDFAAKTPFNVPGIIEAGNRLEALGRYSLDLIRDLGDLAAASGKPVMQAIEAYTNLVTGRTGIAVKQFRAMLISTSDWTRQIGKEVLKTGKGVKASVEEMIEALPEIIKQKNFSGLMDKQSQTLLGMVSNLEDAWQQAMASIGDQLLGDAKEWVKWLTNASEYLRDKAPIIVDTLKDIWYWTKTVALGFVGWKVILGGGKVFLNVIGSMALGFKHLTLAVNKNVSAFKMWRVVSELSKKHGGNMKIVAQQLGRQMGKLKGTVEGVSGAFQKLFLLIRANPITAILTALAGVAFITKELILASAENYKSLVLEAEAKKRNLNLEYERQELKAKEAIQNVELLQQYMRLLQSGEEINLQNEEHAKIIDRMRRAYPTFIDQNGDYAMSLEESAEALVKANRNQKSYEKQLGETKQAVLDTAVEVERLQALAIGQEYKDKLKDSFMELYTRKLKDDWGPTIGGIFGWIQRTADNIFSVSEMRSRSLSGVISNLITKSGNLDQLAAAGTTAQFVVNSQQDEEIKELLQKQLDDQMKAQKEYILQKYKETWKTEDTILGKALGIDKTVTVDDINKKIKEIDGYLKNISGGYDIQVGEDLFSMFVGTGKRDKDGREIADKEAIDERIAFFDKALNDARNQLVDKLKGVEEDNKRKQKETNDAREDLLKLFQEKLALLQVQFQLSSNKDWNKYYADIEALQKDFQENFLDNYTKHSSQELGFKKKTIDALKKLDEDYYREEQDRIDKQTALFNAQLSPEEAKKKTLNFINEVFKDITASGVDLTSEHAVEFFNELKIKIRELTDDINSDETLQVKLRFSQGVQAGGSLADSLPILLGLTPEGINDVRDQLDSLAEKKLQVAEQKILEKEGLTELEREKELYEAQTKILNDQVTALGKVRNELQTQIDFANLSPEMQVYARDFITDLETQVASLLAKMKAMGIELEGDIATNSERMWKKAIQSVKAFTSHLASAVNEWYNLVKDSVDKQVNAWLDGQNKTIDNEEKRGLKFARTKQQEDRIREEADKKREEAEVEADKKAKERLKFWFELKKTASISQILVDTATAIMNAWSGNAYNPVLATAITALIGVTSAAQIAAVNAQELPGFKIGGWTGDEDKNKVVGNVHGQEYVVKSGPAKKYRPILDMLNSDVQGVRGIDVNRDFRMSGYLNDFNNKAAEHLMRLNKTLEHYLANPVPARAYLDNREAEKMTRQGIKKIRRSSL